MQVQSNCLVHNRPFECYCLVCHCLICPTCLMFDAHKGHQVDRIKSGTEQLRKIIDDAGKQGLLNFQKTENILLDLRHSKLSLQENKQQILQIVERVFDDLVKAIKTRKSTVLKSLNEHYSKQKELLIANQEKWSMKQEMAQKVLTLLKQEDQRLIENSQEIIEGKIITSLVETQGAAHLPQNAFHWKPQDRSRVQQSPSSAS